MDTPTPLREAGNEISTMSPCRLLPGSRESSCSRVVCGGREEYLGPHEAQGPLLQKQPGASGAMALGRGLLYAVTGIMFSPLPL